MIKLLFTILAIVVIAVPGTAQAIKVFVQGEYVNAPFVDFIQDVETVNNIKFHYVNDVVKDVRVNAIFRHKTDIFTALEIILRDKPISFMDNGEGGIVLFANRQKQLGKPAQYFTVSGKVSDNNGEAIPFANVVLLGSGRGGVCNENGHYTITLVEVGQQLLQCSSVGHDPLVIKIDVGGDVVVNLTLQESTQQLEELVISPSTFEISTTEATPLTLGKEEILHSPNMGKDIYRTLRALPGIANNDFSAKARIRGGHSDETAVYLDNFLINDAFHLDEVDGSFSIFNTDYIDELKVLTGGYNARYTDRLSGIIDVRTHDNIESDRYKVSIDLLNASLLAQKRINKKVNLFFNVRRGYLDFLLKDMGTDDTDVLEPRFSDLWTKVTFKPNEKNALGFNVLMARDNFLVEDMDEFAAHLKLQNIRNNVNGWVNWKWIPSKDFDAITTMGYQMTGRNATFTFPENVTLDNIDKSDTRNIVLTNNSYYHANENNILEFGGEFKHFVSSYEYREQRYAVFKSTYDNVIIEDVNIDQAISGYTGSIFMQHSLRLFEKLSLQPGLRLSTQSFSRPLKIAPRFALSYDISPSFTTRWSYGVYYQPDTYFRLRTAQFQDKPYDFNSKAIHYTGSLTFSRNKTNVVLNVYHKKYARLFDDYRYEFFNRMGGVNILDVPFNTKRGYAQGTEIMIRQGYGKSSLLSVSYAYSKSRIINASGQETYRDFDQPHTFILNNIFRLPRHWNISLMWSYHTGYPYTPTEVAFIQYRPQSEGVALFYEAGLKNSKRLPHYQSMDLRIEKTWFFGKNQLTAYLNVINFFNRQNLRSYWWYPVQQQNGSIIFDRESQVNIPSFISPGISFTIF
jgi:hypothetical protein